MKKPVIFIVQAIWDEEAGVWAGHCNDIPAAADAPTLDGLMARISAMALDILPDNHPDTEPGQVYLQLSALREAGADPQSSVLPVSPIRLAPMGYTQHQH